MNVPADPPPRSRAFHFFKRESHLVKQRFVCLKQRAVSVQDSDMLRKEIYELPQFVLVLPKFIFSLLTILDVSTRRVPRVTFPFSSMKGLYRIRNHRYLPSSREPDVRFRKEPS